MRFVNLQTIIPWCFQLGWGSSRMEEEEETPIVRDIRLIKSDGSVETYRRPVQVGHLMVEFPNHMICSSDSLYVGQMIPPLSAKHHLRPGRVYFLLPDHLFRSTLSFLTLASFTLSNLPYSSSSATCQPFTVHRTSTGCVRLRVSEEFVKRIAGGGGGGGDGDNSKGRLCTSAVLDKEYRQLVEYRRRWKPVLDPIREAERKRRRRPRSRT